MSPVRRPLIPDFSTIGHLLAFCLLAVVVAPGCSHKAKSDYTSVSKPPTVQLVQPERRNIVRTVGQPSFIVAYERTSIYPKLTGYIEKWIVDIGDKVKKGQVLATLFVPELVEDFGTKKATAKLDTEKIALARKLVEVASADVKAARASLDESKSILGKYEAEVQRWDSEVKRLQKEVDRGVVDPQILLESQNQLKSNTASMNAAKAAIAKAEADLLSRQAQLAKAEVDVSVAQADLAVAESEVKRIAAWVGYITLSAPFDGVIVGRNANTGDFVKPAEWDPTAMQRSPYESPGGTAAPIYVVDRTDVVRIFVDIPEQDANYVQIGTKATVLARAFRDQPIAGSVTRTSWALNIKSRTLRAEIDLPNTESKLLPGMYAYAKVIIERPNVRALPPKAIAYSGDQMFCWEYRDGHAIRNEIQTGVSNGDWIEVTNHRPAAPTSSGTEPEWVPFNGSEQVILGDLSILADGEPVEIAKPDPETKVTTARDPSTGKNAAKATENVTDRRP